MLSIIEIAFLVVLVGLILRLIWTSGSGNQHRRPVYLEDLRRQAEYNNR